MIAVADKKNERYKELSEEERQIMAIIRKDNAEPILPPDLVRGGFSFKVGRLQYDFIYKVSGWRRWSKFDANKKDRLDAEPNKWVDYQLESMFKGW